jgi:hypothetical protein
MLYFRHEEGLPKFNNKAPPQFLLYRFLVLQNHYHFNLVLEDILTYVQILPALHLFDITTKFYIVAMFVIVDLKYLIWNVLLTYGAEPFLRSRQLCSPSGNSQQF